MRCSLAMGEVVCSPINRRKQKHLHLGYMRDHMTGFSYSDQMAELSDSREPFQIVFSRTSKEVFPIRATKSKTSAGSLSEKTRWLLTAYSCNRDRRAGNLIRFVPLSFLKDERQCQTLRTITSCLNKQPFSISGYKAEPWPSAEHAYWTGTSALPLARTEGDGVRNETAPSPKTISQFCHWWLAEPTSSTACLKPARFGSFFRHPLDSN